MKPNQQLEIMAQHLNDLPSFVTENKSHYAMYFDLIHFTFDVSYTALIESKLLTREFIYDLYESYLRMRLSLPQSDNDFYNTAVQLYIDKRLQTLLKEAVVQELFEAAANITMWLEIKTQLETFEL